MCVRACSIQKYKDQFSFLRDAKFIRELENDSLDSDIIDEELNALREAAIRSYTTLIIHLHRRLNDFGQVVHIPSGVLARGVIN